MNTNKLTMKYPAAWWKDMWREGLPAGNGYTGANLYGGAKTDIVQLNRHDFWCGGLEQEVCDVHEHLQIMRDRMDREEFKEASWEIVNAMNDSNYRSELEAHIPLGRLVVEQTPIKPFTHFLRELDMEKAIASHRWNEGEAVMTRELFVSRADDQVVYRLKARDCDPAAVSWSADLAEYVNEGEEPSELIREIWSTIEKSCVIESKREAYLYLHGERKTPQGGIKGFGAAARVSAGESAAEPVMVKNPVTGRLDITGADTIVIRILTYAEGSKEKEQARLHNLLEKTEKSFDEQARENAQLHGALYNSASLKLSRDGADHSNEELLLEAYSGQQSTELIEKLWHFGRYLFICGNAQDSNPFPLYGLWCGAYQPVWCHNMANENMQMIYWHSFCGNLLPLHNSVFSYMNERIPAFENNGRMLFGIDGLYMTAGTTPSVSAPTQCVPVIINWIGASGWIAAHYYMYYLYTRDRKFAEEIMYPYAESTARFYEKFITFTEEGDRTVIHLYPSVSPENTPQNFMPPRGVQMAHPMPTTINSTMDLSVIREFFTMMLDMREVFNNPALTQERVELWKKILASIPEFRVNEKGAIREWQDMHFDDRYDHRHLSHIYPVFPGHEYQYSQNPEAIKPYMEAVRLREIDAQTGWSMAHMSAVYARFGMAKEAMECLDKMARSSLLANFFTLHNDWRGMNISLSIQEAPVQLDAVMGYVNAVQEMLIYVNRGLIVLLPAAGSRLSEGELKSFRYQEGFIDMSWDEKKCGLEFTLRPLTSHFLRVVLPEFARGKALRIDEKRMKGLSCELELTEGKEIHCVLES